MTSSPPKARRSLINMRAFNETFKRVLHLNAGNQELPYTVVVILKPAENNYFWPQPESGSHNYPRLKEVCTRKLPAAQLMSTSRRPKRAVVSCTHRSQSAAFLTSPCGIDPLSVSLPSLTSNHSRMYLSTQSSLAQAWLCFINLLYEFKKPELRVIMFTVGMFDVRWPQQSLRHARTHQISLFKPNQHAANILAIPVSCRLVESCMAMWTHLQSNGIDALLLKGSHSIIQHLLPPATDGHCCSMQACTRNDTRSFFAVCIRKIFVHISH